MSEIIQFEFEASIHCTVPFQDRSKHAKQVLKTWFISVRFKEF